MKTPGLISGALTINDLNTIIGFAFNGLQISAAVLIPFLS
jgi:hypothetical protein